MCVAIRTGQRLYYACHTTVSLTPSFLTGLIPGIVALDDASRVVLELHTGYCDMLGAQIAVSSVQGDIQYLLDKSECNSTRMSNLSFEPLSLIRVLVDIVGGDAVRLGDLEPKSIINISIPYSGNPQGDYTQVSNTSTKV